METVRGIELPELPIAGLQRVRDLHYYDGPLLTEYVNSAGENYLFYWCDCDDTANRWMVLRVTEASILRLANRFVPMDYVIPNGCRDKFVYLVDTLIAHKARQTVVNKDQSRVRLVNISDLPDTYKPEAGAYLEPIRTPSAAKTYSILLEENSGWSNRPLTEFPSIFMKVYALIYGANVLQIPVFANFPWRGGFSSFHFFKWLAKLIPSEDRPFVSAMQFASPGFIRFRLHGQTAELVTKCVRDCLQSDSDSYKELSSYIRFNNLNKIEDDQSSLWDEHNSTLAQLSQQILMIFGQGINTQMFIEKTTRPFEAAKIAMAFYRYVRELVYFEIDGTVKFPETVSELSFVPKV